ncbi:hypothetical protein SAMN05192533_104276 [Mesobacillus persicus]|uniref:DUF5317 domain-containing protein n=1 Tax=Mesobacillus persicus TaxID=930146 RepID=A0A1H8A7J5_9BACI|nr:DUF5317 domain-containing protein [Mesobacillus persicus]SEM66456.1 hypothetical protein SAMN05192533_104276 [Mesobacillus persicus]
MVFDGIILSFIVGLFRKGNLSGLSNLKLKWGWVFPLLLLLQIGIYFLQNKYEVIGNFSGYIFILVYILGLLFLYINRNYPGFSIIFIGVFLNFLVMAINGGRMPVSIEAATVLDPSYTEALKHGLYGKHMLLTETTKLGFLGDIIPLSPPYPRTQVISIGDVIMNIGIFLFIQHLMIGDSAKDKDGVEINSPLQKEVN